MAQQLKVEVRGNIGVELSLSREFFEFIDDTAMRLEVTLEAAKLGVQDKLGGYRVDAVGVEEGTGQIICAVNVEEYASRVRAMQNAYDSLLSRVREAQTLSNEPEVKQRLQSILDDEAGIQYEGNEGAGGGGDTLPSEHPLHGNGVHGNNGDGNDNDDDDDGHHPADSGYQLMMADDGDREHDEDENNDDAAQLGNEDNEGGDTNGASTS
eukprot:PhF_6_TR42673/c1_g1_i1/m.64334